MEKKFINFKLQQASNTSKEIYSAHLMFKYVFLIGIFLASISNAFSQNLKVSGSVTDAITGEPLAGVSIVIAGTTQGTLSDSKGAFSFESLSPDATLVFSFIGYVTEKVIVTDQSAINVKMIPDVTKLDEIVVVGYSSTQRKNIASSVAVVSNSTLTNIATTDLAQALQGKVAGVQVTNTNGDPGSMAKVVIRGVGSFSSADPLYVIDGIAGGDINTISKNDIQNITVLKDASTTAIYGAAGANGVVIITTKSGEKGNMKISYDGTYGTSMIGKRMKLLNASQYVDLVSDIQENNNLTLTDYLSSPDARIDRTDWQDEVFRKGRITDHNLRLGGGNEFVTYSVSGGFFNQKSTIIASEFKRMNFSTKLTEKLFKNRVRLGQTLRIKNEITDGKTSSFDDALRMPPYLTVYDPTVLGGYSRSDKVRDLNDANNPFATVYLSPQNNRYLNSEFEFTGEIDLFKGLIFKTQSRFTAGNTHNKVFNYPLRAGNFERLTANMSESFDYSYSLMLENFFIYDRTFGIHNINLTAGNSYSPSGYSGQVSLTGSGYSSNELQNIIYADEKTISGTKVNGGKARTSYFGRLGYTLNEKYVINTTIRRDASSVFGSNYRNGTFWGAGVAWNVSQESFMNSIEAINNLKLRGSYGKTGNDNIPMFLTSSTVWKGSSNNLIYSFGDTDGTFIHGATVSSMPNPNLKWEETTQIDVGFDISLFKKVSIVFDYFNRDNKDLLIEAALPSSTGLGIPGQDAKQWVNAASMKNTGCELGITYNGNIDKFKWDVNINATYSTNEVTALGTTGNSPITSGYSNGTRTDIGHPLASFYGYKVDHIAIDQADIDKLNAIAVSHGFTEYQSGLLPGDRIWQDVTGDGHIDDKDRTYIGNPAPKWQYGLMLNCEYKGFDLQVMMQGLAGVDVVNANRFWLEGMTKPFNSYTTVLDRWQQPGDVAPLPAAGQNSGNNTLFSDWYVEKGDYMRIKNIALGYTLPSGFIKNTKIRIYLALQNILTITKYSGYDPEISASDNSATGYIFNRGIDNGQHPNPKIYRLGLQLNF